MKCLSNLEVLIVNYLFLKERIKRECPLRHQNKATVNLTPPQQYKPQETLPCRFHTSILQTSHHQAPTTPHPTHSFKMLSPPLTKALLLLSHLLLTHALDFANSISKFSAGTSITLSLTNDLSHGRSSTDKAYDSYRLYLVANAVGDDLDEYLPPSCYLVSSVPISTTSVRILPSLPNMKETSD